MSVFEIKEVVVANLFETGSHVHDDLISIMVGKEEVSFYAGSLLYISAQD